MAEIFNCEFNSPRTWENLPPVSKTEYWNYSQVKCYSEIVEPITDGTSTFNLVKTFSFGDFFLIFFFVVLILALMFDFIFRFVYKIKVNFRH